MQLVMLPLQALPADATVLMEFMASWCPACRHFKPDYEHIARFCAAKTTGADKIHVFRVDCAEEVRGVYCCSVIEP